MRGPLLGALVWLGLGGVAAAASDGSAPPVLIQAGQGQPAHMATYRGPGGTPIPIGACGAVIDGRVWVLPCSDPRVVAYQQAEAARTARATRTQHERMAGAVVILAAGVASAVEYIHRRRTRGEGG